MDVLQITNIDTFIEDSCHPKQFYFHYTVLSPKVFSRPDQLDVIYWIVIYHSVFQ